MSNVCLNIILLYLWYFSLYNDVTCLLFVCTLCLVNTITGYRILGWQFFFLITWIILFNIFAAFMISDENSNYFSFKLMLLFFSVAFKIYSLYYIFRSIMCLVADLSVFILFRVCSDFLFCRLIYFSCQIWGLLQLSFSSLLLGLWWHKCYIFCFVYFLRFCWFYLVFQVYFSSIYIE